ncbi:MAG: DUF3347 domain-containing protein [Candidatus Omnitrophota bacterium]|jgi:Cu(I)/Ag(I) efflux system membrane fusion protein|nr:MAG: DUF3347 domain-containing protein [Candidatus Omnitrophota bacterium]
MNWNQFMNRSTYLILVIGILIGMGLMWLSSPSSNMPSDHSPAHEAADSKQTIWTCSMHPQIRQPNPGKCPICGMDLIPVSQKEAGDDSPRRLVISESAKKLAEIQTAAVERRVAKHELRLVGKVDYDETRLKYITAWFPGRLERLFVDYTGTPIKKGEHLVQMYSPEILTDQESLLQALQADQQLSNSTVSYVQRNKKEMLDRARERLRLLGLTDSQISEIEQRGAPSDRITFYSPIDGIVIQKNAFAGDYVKTGARIYAIADLTHVWIKIDAYESDLQWLRYGQDVEFSTVSYPGEAFHGRIAFIDPYLNEQTRTVKVRVNVPNPDGKLKPEMFVRAVVRSDIVESGRVLSPELTGKWMCSMHPEIVKEDLGDCDICEMPLVTAESLGFAGLTNDEQQAPLLIPASAPLLTGVRAVVYVEVPDAEKPTYEGREITLGPRVGEFYIVKTGLTEGERVVVNGNFKLDSALQILAKPSMMSPEGGMASMAHDHSSTTKPEPAREKPDDHGNATEARITSHALSTLLPHYKSLAEALVADDLDFAKRAGEKLTEAANSHQSVELSKLGRDITQASSLEDARKAFALLSEILIRGVEQVGTPNDPLFTLFCPMAFDNRGARWLQWDENVRNPYFGAVMLTCGAVEHRFLPNRNENEHVNH